MRPETRRLIAPFTLSLWTAVAACEGREGRKSPAPNVNSSIVMGSDTLGADEIRSYLASSLGFTSRGGRVFCSYTVLGQEGDRVYLATACEEFVLVADSLESGSGRGGPVALVVDTLSRPIRVVRHRVPGDGNRYARDIREIFPREVQRHVLARSVEQTRQMGELRLANREAAAAHLSTGGNRER